MRRKSIDANGGSPRTRPARAPSTQSILFSMERPSHVGLAAGHFIFSANYILNENVSMTRHKIAVEQRTYTYSLFFFHWTSGRWVFFLFYSHDDAMLLSILNERTVTFRWCEQDSNWVVVRDNDFIESIEKIKLFDDTVWSFEAAPLRYQNCTQWVTNEKNKV